MRASRLVNLLLLLQTRGQMTARELSRELEVSERTIYRDVDALSASGVPIYAERGSLGGIRLVEGYRTRLTGLTADEAEALFLSGLPGPAAELGLGTVVAAARLKVLAALPPELRNRASRITERFHIDAPGWFQSPDVVPFLSDLASAVWESRRIRLTYRRPDRVGVVTRETEPLGIVLKGGIWYLVARTAGQFRTYRVSRTIAVELTTETFERPDGFDLGRHWAGSIAAYEKDFQRVDLVLRVPEDRLDDVWCVLGRDRARIGPAEPDGTHVVRAAFEWDDEALTAAIRLSPVADVLEPASVRASMETFARSILARRMEPPAELAPERVGAAATG